MTREMFKVKEFLSSLNDMEIAIRIKLEKLEDMRQFASVIRSSFSEERVQRSRKYHKLEDDIIRIIEYENSIKRDINKYYNLVEKIKSVIDRVPDLNKRNILEMRYINFYKWEEIQRVVNYEESWIRRLHAQGLKEIAKDKELMEIINEHIR